MNSLQRIKMKNAQMKGEIEDFISNLGNKNPNTNSNIEDVNIQGSTENKYIFKDMNNSHIIIQLVETCLKLFPRLHNLNFGWEGNCNPGVGENEYFEITKYLLQCPTITKIYINFFKNDEDEYNFNEIINLVSINKTLESIKLEYFHLLDEHQGSAFIGYLLKLPKLVSIKEITCYTRSDLQSVLMDQELPNNIKRIKWIIESTSCESNFSPYKLTHMKIVESLCISNLCGLGQIEVLEICYQNGCGGPLDKKLFRNILDSKKLRIFKCLGFSQIPILEVYRIFCMMTKYNTEQNIDIGMIKGDSKNIPEYVYINLWMERNIYTNQLIIHKLDINCEIKLQNFIPHILIRSFGHLHPIDLTEIRKLFLENTFKDVNLVRLAIYPGWHNLMKLLILAKEFEIEGGKYIFDCRCFKRSWPKKRLKNKERDKFFAWLRTYSRRGFGVIKIALFVERLTSEEIRSSPSVYFTNLPKIVEKKYV